MFRTLGQRQVNAPGRQLIASGFHNTIRSALIKGFQPIQRGLHFVAGVSHGIDSLLTAASHIPVAGAIVNTVRSNPLYGAISSGIDTADRLATGLYRGAAAPSGQIGMNRPPSRFLTEGGGKRLRQ